MEGVPTQSPIPRGSTLPAATFVFGWAVALTLLCKPGVTKEPAPLRRPVSPSRPVILLPDTRQGPAATVADIAPELRPFVVLQVGAMHSAAHRERLHQRCRRARDEHVPLALHVRTFRPVASPRDYDGTVTPPAVVDGLLARYPNIVAVIDAEQYGFTAEQRRYFCRLLAIADRHGVWCILDAGWHGGPNWDELNLDARVRTAVAAHRRVFVPMWEMNISEGMYHEHAQLLGLWLSGQCEQWGANPQTWLWGEAGFGELGESFGWRYLGHGGMDAARRARRWYPFYGQSVLLPAVTGATFFWIGGEAPPHVWDAAGRPSTWWRGTLEPVFKAVVEWRLIPRRADVSRAVRLFVTNRNGWPFVVDEHVAHSGRRSLRLECGAGRSVHLSWRPDEPLELPLAKRMTVAGWVRCRNVTGTAYLDFSWLQGDRWQHRRTRTSSGSRDWTRLEKTFALPTGSRFAQLALCAHSATGTVWYDDVSLSTPEDGANLLPNPGFELLRPGGKRPLFWNPGGGYGSPELDRCDRGVNALWKAAYGAAHPAEFLPNTTTAFPIVCLPGASSALPQGASAPVLDVEVLDRAVPALPRLGMGRPQGPFVFKTPNLLFAANSLENEDRSQPFVGDWRRLHVEASLPVHHFLLVRRLGDTIHLLCSGRRNRKTVVTLASLVPLDVLSPLAAGTTVRASSDRKTFRLVLIHKQRKTLSLSFAEHRPGNPPSGSPGRPPAPG